jgi:hypothetical protein
MKWKGGTRMVRIKVKEIVSLGAYEVMGCRWTAAVETKVSGLIRDRTTKGYVLPGYTDSLGHLKCCFERFPVYWCNAVKSQSCSN